MKTLIQKYSNGEISLIDIPKPTPDENEILVQTAYSAVSIGTESSIIKLAKKSLIGKAIDRPDLVKRVFQKLNQTGIKETISEVLNRLDNPIPLGYSASGIVRSIGTNVKTLKVGDSVALVGASFANHSEFNLVSENMTSKCSKEILKESSFGMLGCICLNSIRQIKKPIGGLKIGVIGAGVLGNITAQILLSYGANVSIFDPNSSKGSVFAGKKGVKFFSDRDQFINSKNSLNQGKGFDAVIIACGVKDNAPLIDALEVIIENGEIVVLGVVDINVDRNILWNKQASIIVSKAGGFGSLDRIYESSKSDFPIEGVRWSLKRNLEEFINLISNDSIDITNLITKKILFEDSVKIYEELSRGEHSDELGIILEYNHDIPEVKEKPKKNKSLKFSGSFIGVIGAGLHGSGSVLPILKKIKGKTLHTICTKTGLSAERNRAKFGFANASTDRVSLLENNDISTIFSFEPHHLHYDTVKRSISSKKNLFLEKPLCVSREELNKIIKLTEENKESLPLIFIGHNRRYSSSVKYFKQLASASPMIFTMEINAGEIPNDHWIYDKNNGGDRCIAECSHFIDLANFIVSSPIIDLDGKSIRSGNIKYSLDNFCVSFIHKNGSISNLIYSSEGNRSNPREIFKIFQDGNIFELIDFKISRINTITKKIKYDLGFQNEIDKFFSLIEKPENNYDQMLLNIDSMDKTLNISEKVI